MTFADFFHTATGKKPYSWQSTLGETSACASRLIEIPTGLGKTAGVVLAWLWNRWQPETTWPRRLVYCLPMRTLVEQTRDNVNLWLDNLARAHPDNLELQWLAEHSPIVLMGGEELDANRKDWHLHPERPAILIGTQDMLLSRALNRGYGAGRARWPQDFGLLNNDCLWVMDEVQLMANGFSTSLQLQAWRYSLETKDSPDSVRATAKSSTVLPTHTWWMSATMAVHWFETAVDWRRLKLDSTKLEAKKMWEERLKLEDSDKKDKRVSGLLGIMKSKIILRDITPLKAKGRADNKELNVGAYAHSIAGFIAKEKIKTETADLCILLVVNTVERAVSIYNAIKTSEPFNKNNVLLLHSRFRRAERQHWPAHIKAFENGGYTENSGVPQDQRYAVSGPRLIIASQVIEAGVDLSVPILYTERCPLASLIQRVGRCARRADEVGKVYILPMVVSEETAKPYDLTGLEAWQPGKESNEQTPASPKEEKGEPLPDCLGIGSLSSWIEKIRNEDIRKKPGSTKTLAETQRTESADDSTSPQS
ncbi:MAG: DEAD/DEAH box helicase [Verrucomicrobiia bacterium]